MMKLSTALLALALPGTLLAQANRQAPAGPRNLIHNGSFESFWQVDNLWDGVDNNGFLAGSRDSVDAVTERGTVDAVPMPISVQLGDMNNDGLIDIVTVDLEGYIRVYFNSGTKTEPKFTHGELVPVYLSGFDRDGERKALKAALYDMNGSGAKDLVLGTYSGEILLLRNAGNANVPDFRQPSNLDTIKIPTTKAGNLWANLFAPAVGEWSRPGSGIPDLLVGEGSYSANSIHLLTNIGNGSSPRFNEDNRHYLAYGDGKEQLIPAIVDYNGDGFPDLIVGDRLGNLSVYLSDGRWEKDKETKFTSTITFTGGGQIRSAIAPAVGDLNGDGLFDIVIGKTNGRVAVAYNTGTKEQPKFGALTEIKGTDIWKRNTMRNPSDWSIDFGRKRGNLLGYTTVVNEKDDPAITPVPEKKSVLKIGYHQPQNKIIRYNPLVIPASRDAELSRTYQPNTPFTPTPWRAVQAQQAGMNSDSNVVIIRKFLENSQIKPDTNYAFSFKVRGAGIRGARWTWHYAGQAEMTERTVTRRRDRGVDTTQVVLNDDVIQTAEFGVGGNWTTVQRTVKFTFPKERQLNDPEKLKAQAIKPPVYRGMLEIRATVTPLTGVFYIDDVQLIEQK